MKNLYIFLLALAVAVCHCQENKKCPAREDIKPCTCMNGKDGKVWITCAGISSVAQLRPAIQRMLGSQISTFYLENSNLGILPADVFRGLFIESMNIMFSNLTSLSDGVHVPPFLGLEQSLESLEIKDSFSNQDTPLAVISLSHLKKLTLLQLEGNAIPSLGNNWFESGPYQIKELYILDSSTKKVGSHAFTFLRNLKKFSLTGGSISQITRAMFPKPALGLEAIDFSDNSLSELPADIFTSMPSLTEVYLDNNAFIKINEISFSSVWSQLTHVFVFGNPINCDINMRWMYKYRLPEFLHGLCALPRVMTGKELAKLTLKDFDGNIY